MTTATHTIRIEEKWLSDGSAVYGVRIKDHEHPADSGVFIDAVDRGAAYRMAETMRGMFNNPRNALSVFEISDQTYA